MPPKKRTVSSGKDKPTFSVGGADELSDDDKSAILVQAAGSSSNGETLRAHRANSGVSPGTVTPDSNAPDSTPAATTPSSSSNNNNGRTVAFKKDAPLKVSTFTSLKEAEAEEEDDMTRWERYKSQPSTPNLADTAHQIRRSLSIAGLSQLASDQSGGIKHKLWRPANEEPREPDDWERLAVHVVRGGLRAGLTSFGLRGSVMLVFALIRLLRTRKFSGKDLLLCYFGGANGRFAAMFAIWATLYKATHNSLRLMTPPPAGIDSSSRRKPSSASKFYDEAGGGSGTATPRSGHGELEGKTDAEKAKIKSKQKRKAFMHDPRSKVWHAYVAGAVSALAVMAETKDMRITLAQQLFVRGLEGSYNLLHGNGFVTIPYGSVLVFGIACGQIMYAWVNAPDTLPRGYISWITKASHAGTLATPIQREIYASNGRFNPQWIYKYLGSDTLPEPVSLNPLRYPNIAPNATNINGVTGRHVRTLVQLAETQKRGERVDFVPCTFMHPYENSHLWSPVDRMIRVTRWILPVYMTLYFVPAVFLRTKSFIKAPLRIVLRSLFGSVRSSAFLGAFVVIFQTIFCGSHQLAEMINKSPTLSKNMPAWVKDALLHPSFTWFAGFMTCLSLFVDDARRRAELAAYVLPKGMESAWSIARQRSWVPFVPGGDLLLTSAGMSMVMGTYAQNPEHLSGLVRRIIYQFVGRN